MEEHRRRIRNEFAAGLEAIGRDLRDASSSAAAVDIAVRIGPSPRRNAVALVGAIVEMTVDWLHDPEPDPLERLIDDIAHRCRRVLAGIITEAAGS
jgi:hypothetical protein